MIRDRPRVSPVVFLSSLAVTALVSYQVALSTTAHCLLKNNDGSAYSEAILPLQPHRRSSRISILESKYTLKEKLTIRNLVETFPETSCASDKLILVNDTFILDDDSPASASATVTDSPRRQIPRVLHVTTKSRCLPKQFADNLQLWKDALPDHSFVLHNDAAMEALLFPQSPDRWPEFPHLTQALQSCSLSVAAKADLWRALVLWEYGGIYTDIDNAPRKFNSSSIALDDEAYFVVEEAGYLSQYFMAARPKHPLMFLLIQATLHRLYDLRDVDHQYVPYVTGPGALKEAFLHFRHEQGPNQAVGGSNNKKKSTNATSLVKAGHYTGLGNSSVTVVGRRSDSDEFVARNVIYKKRRIYQQLMNMTHFSRVHASSEAKAKLNTDSCFERVWLRSPQQARRSFTAPSKTVS